MATRQKSTAQRVRHVVCAIDSQMVYALAVAMSSLQKSATRPFRLTIGYLAGTLSESDRNYLGRIMDHIGVAYSFSDLGSDPRFITQGHISPTTFAKFLLADQNPEAHLWLDADTVALPEWESIFGLLDATTPEQGLLVAQRGADKLGLPFNAGVLGWPTGPRRDWSSRLNQLELVDTQEQYLFNELYAPTAKTVSERYNSLTYRIDRIPGIDPPFIIHYAGAHKPWHLPRPLNGRCVEHRCPWSAWFTAEAEFLDGLDGPGLLAETRRRQHSALRCGTVRWQRDHVGLIFLRILVTLGPLGRVLVGLLRPLASRAPRGTHPLH
jgi:lipopolysaccharide biosynthesis glycosyltransferase